MDLRGELSSQMSCCLISVARARHYEHFTEYLFQSIAVFQWKCVRFQRTAVAVDLPEDQIASLCLCIHLYLQINAAQQTSVWVLGGDKVLHFTLFSTLYITLSQHETFKPVSEWVSENASKFVTLWTVASFSAGIFPPPPQNSSWCFVLSTDIWLAH